MYLERRSLADIPKDAIIVNDEDVLKYYNSHIFGTTVHKRIVWPFTYGLAAASCVALGTNSVLLYYFRRRLRLKDAGKIISGVVLVGFPTIYGFLYHYAFIQRDIILQSSCTMCLKAKAIFIQNLISVGCALGPGALMSMLHAYMQYTYPIPGFSNKEELKGTLKVYLKMCKRIPLKILVCILLNTAAISVLTHAEYKAFDELNEVLQEQDEKLRSLAAEYNNKM